MDEKSNGNINGDEEEEATRRNSAQSREKYRNGFNLYTVYV